MLFVSSGQSLSSQHSFLSLQFSSHVSISGGSHSSFPFITLSPQNPPVNVTFWHTAEQYVQLPLYRGVHSCPFKFPKSHSSPFSFMPFPHSSTFSFPQKTIWLMSYFCVFVIIPLVPPE